MRANQVHWTEIWYKRQRIDAAGGQEALLGHLGNFALITKRQDNIGGTLGLRYVPSIQFLYSPGSSP